MYVENYLDRIGYKGDLSPSIEVLTSLQDNHVKSIPFENIDIINKKKIILDEKLFYKKIIENNRGGICYELNGLFNSLLKQLSFDSYLISATIANCEKENTHACIISVINKKKFLVDVGYGNIYRGPIPLNGQIVEDISGSYYIKHNGHDEYLVVKISEGKETILYRFYDVMVNLEYFSEGLFFNVYNPASVFNKNELITIAIETGRVTLSNKEILKISRDIVRNSQMVDNYELVLKNYFGITLA